MITGFQTTYHWRTLLFVALLSILTTLLYSPVMSELANIDVASVLYTCHGPPGGC